MALEAVAFDVGETLVDETRYWGEWADRLGVPRLTFFGVLGALAARGDDHRRVFELCVPGLDLAATVAAEEADGYFEGADAWFAAGDLYGDAAPAIAELRASGLKVGVAANRPEGLPERLAGLGIELDFAGSSGAWGAWKPHPAFFDRLASEAGAPPERIAYVGDRVDNDVLPAKRAGMVAVHIRRGPWGHLHAEWPEAALADVSVDSLRDLSEALADV